jgi:hypothetical protein
MISAHLDSLFIDGHPISNGYLKVARCRLIQGQSSHLMGLAKRLCWDDRFVLHTVFSLLQLFALLHLIQSLMAGYGA